VTCSCIYASQCEGRAGCALAADATVTPGGGIYRRRDDSTGSRAAPGASGDAPAGDGPQDPQGADALTTRERDQRVGVGPTYTAIRDAARWLVPLFAPPGRALQPQWGAGLVTVEPAGDGQHDVAITHPVCSRFVKRRNSLVATVGLVELRSMAITLLAYCETHPDG
jgi:hypothetical protein